MTARANSGVHTAVIAKGQRHILINGVPFPYVGSRGASLNKPHIKKQLHGWRHLIAAEKGHTVPKSRSLVFVLNVLAALVRSGPGDLEPWVPMSNVSHPLLSWLLWEAYYQLVVAKRT
jgi:hypothetical protein